MDGDASGQGCDQDRRARWLAPHPFNPTRRYTDFAIDPWHYTTREGLEGIIASNTLWATESGGLNDPSEVKRAAQSLLEVWDASLVDLKPGAPAEEAGAWLGEMTAMASRRRFFFVSACYDGDKLQHWKSYAGGRGFALEFDRNREFRLLEPPLELGRPLYWPGFAPSPWWRAVTYGDYETGKTASGGSLFAGRAGIMEHALNEFAARARGERPDEVAFWEHLESAYLASVCFNKHEAYTDEEEARMVFIEPPWPDFVHHREGGFNPSGRTAFMKVAAAPVDEPATYSVSGTDRLPIRRVRIGPRFGTDVAREIGEIAGLLHEHGYTGVEVTASTIPFRG